MQFIFDYSTFYNYYTNPQNLLIDNNPNTMIYFIGNKQNRSTTPNTYITIAQKKIFITDMKDSKKQLLFSTKEHIVNNIIYDNHYHFGIEPKIERSSLNNIPINTIFFHKTLQLPSTNDTFKISCYFRDGTSITDIEQIICTNQKNSIFKNNFSFNFLAYNKLTYNEDLEFISEIISRPFLGIKNPGGGFCKYDEIINPITNRKIKITGKTAKNIANKYINKKLKLSKNIILKFKQFDII